MRGTDYYSTTRRGSGLVAFLIGGLIGGTLALLYAPQSGKKTRDLLVNEGQETADQVMKSIHDAQESVLATIEDAQARMESMKRSFFRRDTRKPKTWWAVNCSSRFSILN